MHEDTLRRRREEETSEGGRDKVRERDEASAMSALPDTSGRARPDLARPPIEIDLTKPFAASAAVTVVVHFAADELLTGMAMDERTFRRGLTD